MKTKHFLFILLTAAGFAFNSCSSITTSENESALENIIAEFKFAVENSELSFPIPNGTKVRDFEIDDKSKIVSIRMNKRFSYRPFREEEIQPIKNGIKQYFGDWFSDYKIEIYSLGFLIEELVPNLYRNNIAKDNSRIPLKRERPKPVVRDVSKPFQPTMGLDEKNIALWHSHGWYYNHDLDRWLWQRARLFQMVEDIGPMSFTVPYLVPMMENAGANVFLPRERDVQTHEVVIDNDATSEAYKEKFIGAEYEWITGSGNGFLYGTPPYEANYNPFLYGTYRIAKSSETVTAFAQFIPDIPEDGEYAVYIAYKSSDNKADDAHYSVYHLGGKTEFEVNQQIGGGTWIYLGTFKFGKGVNPDLGSVTLDNKSSTPGKFVSADAVRFGGGMGNVLRGGATSGRPKFTEGARYWLQYAGMPDTLVYNINNDRNDYKDDYQCRGEWVNYLIGAPYGPNKKRDEKGLGIPIDISLAFHTDAGLTKNDTTIGTLSIYSITDPDSNFIFPDGISRIANRDLADILQTQIVDDLRAKYDTVWNRRYLWDGMYSEAARPNVPSVLLELLSHENFLDTKFQLDPRYRFDVARSIYKAFLKYLTDNSGKPYVVQPLPVNHFSAVFDKQKKIVLKWQPQVDRIEPTANPEKYIVYTRINNGGFDNGVLVQQPFYELSQYDENTIYSFKVTAVNAGGESFPSEILSVCNTGKDEPVLIVNAFDRIDKPASVQTDKFTGYLDVVDEGVPDKYDLSYIGSQFNFQPDSKWLTDDMPGQGASYGNYETKIIAGNTFDFPFVHGSALKQINRSFVSVSDESVEDSVINLSDYKFVDVIFGEEKETSWPKPFTDSLLGTQYKVFTEKFRQKISDFLTQGGKLFLSGSYLGTDMFLDKPKEGPDAQYSSNTLKYKLDADHAVKHGSVYSIDESFLPKDFSFEFNTDLNDSIYAAEAPDALGAVNGSKTILRFIENNFNAAIGYKADCGIVAFGFPFETILGEKNRVIVMQAIINYLNR